VKRLTLDSNSDSDSPSSNVQGSSKKPRISQDEAGTGPNALKPYLELEKVQLIVEDEKFLVHAYKIKEFAKLNEMLENAKTEEDLRVIELPEIVASVAPLIEVLYTPVYDMKIFDVDTLVTVLIFGTKYEHSKLREYAIERLKLRQKEIPPMRRIGLSRAYDLPDWMPHVIEELAEREQTITLEEANELGAEVFTDVLKRREKAKFSKGKQAGVGGSNKDSSKFRTVPVSARNVAHSVLAT
ncbi:hypothetical protein FRC07_005377, partial [Ceratobasidium sp. 392]